jgi:5'(3')-deoxyribonucleotidase
MDGVLDDFVGAACRAHNRTCYDKPEHYGIFDMEKCWGITPKQFWEPTEINAYKFWRNLEKTPEADRIVELVTEKFGVENVAILTAAAMHPMCAAAKRDWIREYYPQFEKRMIFAQAKGFVGGPKKVLIDDRDRNIEDWEKAGGVGILVPRLWNVGYDYADIPFDVISDEIEFRLFLNQLGG